MTSADEPVEARPSPPIEARQTKPLTLARVTEAAPAAVTVLIVVALYVTTLSHASTPLSYTQALSWATLVLGSFVGWGALVNTVCFRDHRADLGLRAAWGMVLSIFLGSLLLLAKAVSPASLHILVGAGLLLACADAWRGRHELVDSTRATLTAIREQPGLAIGIAALFVLVGLQFAASGLQTTEWAHTDDAPAYFVFPKQMLQTGDMDQPFSLRRISSYGGQSVLHALVMVGSSVERLHFVDMGISSVIAFLLVLGASRGQRRAPLILIPLFFMVSVPNIQTNTQSAMSGVVIFLGLFRTLTWVERQNGPRIENAVPLALLVAAAWSLRQNYSVPALALLGTSYALFFWKSRERRAVAREAVACGGFVFLFLLPWALCAARSVGTFLFPVLRGNFRALKYFELHVNAAGWARIFWTNISHQGVVATLPLFLLSALLTSDRSQRRAMLALYVGSALGFASLVRSIPRVYEGGVARYYFGFEVAAVLAIALVTLVRGEKKPGWPAILVAAACLLQIHDWRQTVRDKYLAFIDSIRGAVAGAPHPVHNEPADKLYADMQEAMAPGEKALVMVDEPFRMNFARNTVYIIDMPGFVSPDPGMPIQSAEATATYLRSQAIRYFAYVEPTVSRDLYNRATWERHAASVIESDAHPSEHKNMAPIVLPIFDTIDNLAKTFHVVYRKSGLVVIDLSAPA